jgi:predicted AAA+ superfamily ATPase
VKAGGRYLFLDEVHKYPDWSREVKNIYDDYPELQIVFTGSSLLQILNARADLSRRSIHYELQGLSFREYLHFAHGKKFEAVSLTNLLAHSDTISAEVIQSIRPLAFFKDYLKSGYYPYAQESRDSYHERLASVVNLILELELPQLRQVDIAYVPKLKKLLLAIAESAPFTPNVSALSRKIGVNRETIMTYLYHLASAGLTRQLFKTGKGITRLQKPDKIFLDNTNLAYAIRPHGPDMGMLRETFFASQVGYQHQLSYPEKGDVKVDDQWTFEIGGKNKNRSQIKNVPHSFVALDGIEMGHSHRIPLWLFGFLY